MNDDHASNDAWWQEAARALAHMPHAPKPMASLNSTPPIYDWVCYICMETSYSVTTVPPVCEGGLPYG